MNLKNTYLILVLAIMPTSESSAMLRNPFNKNPPLNSTFDSQDEKGASGHRSRSASLPSAGKSHVSSEFELIEEGKSDNFLSKKSSKNKSKAGSFKLEDMSSVQSIKSRNPNNSREELRNALHHIKYGQSLESILLENSAHSSYRAENRAPENNDKNSFLTLDSIYEYILHDKETQTERPENPAPSSATQKEPAERPELKKIAASATQTDPVEQPELKKTEVTATQTEPPENPAPAAVYVPVHSSAHNSSPRSVHSPAHSSSYGPSTHIPDFSEERPINADANPFSKPTAPTATVEKKTAVAPVAQEQPINKKSAEIETKAELEKSTALKTESAAPPPVSTLHKLILHFIAPAKNIWSNVRNLFRQNFAYPPETEETLMNKKLSKKSNNLKNKPVKHTPKSMRPNMQELWIEFLAPFNNLWSDVRGFFKKHTLKTDDLPENIKIHQRTLRYKNISAFPSDPLIHKKASKKRGHRFVAAKTKRLSTRLATLGGLRSISIQPVVEYQGLDDKPVVRKTLSLSRFNKDDYLMA